MVETFFITYNSENDIEECISTFSNCDFLNLKVYDNRSTDKNTKIAKDLLGEENVFVSKFNNGYSCAVNNAMSIARSNIVIVANADVKISKSEIKNLKSVLIDFEKSPNLALAGVQQIFFDERYQKSLAFVPSYLEILLNIFFILPVFDYLTKKLKLFKIIPKSHYIDGAFLIINRKIFNQIGGFDQEFNFFGEEVDYCKRMHDAGYQIKFYRNCKIYHRRGGSYQIGPLDFSVKHKKLLTIAKMKFAKKHLFAFKLFFYLFLLNSLSKILLYRIFLIIFSYDRLKMLLKLNQLEFKTAWEYFWYEKDYDL